MIPLSLSQITVMSGGKLLAGDPAAIVQGVCTDSRKIQPGNLFVALRGDNFDGHHFLSAVASAGATAVIVDDYPKESALACGVILVTDTLAALQNLARNYRRQLDCKIIGITGSNGKTSTKDLTAAVLGSRFQVSKTAGNLNNHIGLPLSILATDRNHQAVVWEMGMNHPGEIAPLAAMAAPDVAIITNIGIAHIEYMGTREAIAVEKSALAEAVEPQGDVILNANDDFTDFIRGRCRGNVRTAGIDLGDLRLTDLRTEVGGSRYKISFEGEKIDAFLPIPGRHMAGNAALAMAAGLVCGIPVAEAAFALETVQLTAGRLQSRLVRGIHFLDDSYNANPDSMLAALDTLRGMPGFGRKIAVLGAMGELGEHAEAGHYRVGAAVGGIDFLIVVGEKAEAIARGAVNVPNLSIMQVADTEEAATQVLDIAREGDCVLVKGSRSTRMERVIQFVQNTLPVC